MAIPLLHSDAFYLDQEVGNNVLGANNFPFYSDAQLQAATNTAGLKVLVDAYAGHSETEGFKPGVKRALDLGNTSGSLSDANVQAATTAATLAANTTGSPGKNWPLAL